jgi:hypothetical protein
VAIRELEIDRERGRPSESVLFSLNMALYTEGGRVYDAGELRGFLAAAGLSHPTATTLDGGGVVVIAARTE